MSNENIKDEITQFIISAPEELNSRLASFIEGMNAEKQIIANQENRFDNTPSQCNHKED